MEEEVSQRASLGSRDWPSSWYRDRSPRGKLDWWMPPCSKDSHCSMFRLRMLLEGQTSLKVESWRIPNLIWAHLVGTVEVSRKPTRTCSEESQILDLGKVSSNVMNSERNSPNFSFGSSGCNGAGESGANDLSMGVTVVASVSALLADCSDGGSIVTRFGESGLGLGLETTSGARLADGILL